MLPAKFESVNCFWFECLYPIVAITSHLFEEIDARLIPPLIVDLDSWIENDGLRIRRLYFEGNFLFIGDLEDERIYIARGIDGSFEQTRNLDL